LIISHYSTELIPKTCKSCIVLVLMLKQQMTNGEKFSKTLRGRRCVPTDLMWRLTVSLLRLRIWVSPCTWSHQIWYWIKEENLTCAFLLLKYH